MSVEFTARGSGYFRVFVDGVQISQHVTERKMWESATNAKLANPDAIVTFDRDYEGDVIIVGRTGQGGGASLPSGGGGSPEGSYFSTYTMELVSPRAGGTAPSVESGTPNFPSDHRIHYAHTDFAYKIPVVVFGGAWPFTYVLSNEPSGMTVSTDGVITWTSPTGTTETPTITVTDALGTEVSASWTITISNAQFKFVDAVSGSDAAAGTISAPWQTLEGVWDNTNDTDDIIVFRGGTYTLANCPTGGTGAFYYARIESTKSAMWIGYPGETPIIDFYHRDPTTGGVTTSAGHTPHIRLDGGSKFYMQGLRFTDHSNKCFYINTLLQYACIFNCDFPTFNRDDADHGGSNPAVISLAHWNPHRYYFTLLDNTFDDLSLIGSFKFYGVYKAMYDRNTVTNSYGIGDWKASTPKFCQRGNTATTITDGVYGNMDIYGSDPGTSQVHGEVSFNYLYTTGYTVRLVDAKIADVGNMNIFRNTLRGRIELTAITSSDGDYEFYNNVIINTDGAESPFPYFYDHDNTVTTPVVLTDNLTGAEGDSIVDASGLLQGSYRTTYLNARGHEVA